MKPPSSYGAGVSPFTIEQVEERYGPASSLPSVDYVTYARRRDGSVAHSYCYDCARDGSHKPTIEYVDATSLTVVQLEPVTKSTTSRPILTTDLAGEIDRVIKGCDGSEVSKGSETSAMLGYEVVKVTAVESLGTEVRWVAPKLNCYPLQLDYTTKDGRSRIKIYVKSVVEGEPASHLFTSPSDFLERSPKDRNKAYSDLFPGVQYYSGVGLERFERVYQESRARKGVRAK